MATKKVKVPSSWNAKPVTKVGGGSGGVRKPSSPYSSVKRPLPSSERLPLTPKPKSTAKPAAKTKIELLREAAKTKPKSPAPRGTATPKPTAKPVAKPTAKPNSKASAPPSNNRPGARPTMPNSSRAGINLPRAAVNALPKPIGPTTKEMTPAAMPAVKRPAGVTANYQMLTNPTQNRGAGQRVTGGQAGGRAGKPSGSIARPKPTAATTAAAKSKLLGKGAVGTAIVGSILNAPEEIRKGVRLAKDPKGAVSDVLKGLGFTEGFLSKFNKKGGTSKEDKRSNRPGGGSKPKEPARPASDYEKLFQTGGGRANYGLDKKDDPVRKREPVAPLPASITPRSSGSGSSRSTPRSTSPARVSTATTTPPSEKRVSASTANRTSGNYGTSKTNNPLMKDMIKRMKDREDKEQASKAQQLTDKSRQNSGYSSAEKVDGSKYADELKKKKGFKFSVSS